MNRGRGTIRLKRAYERPAPEDGQRFLVERLWPRGVRKVDLRLHGWLKDVAPSPELRRWFSHDPKKWPEFRRRYLGELRTSENALAPLLRFLPGIVQFLNYTPWAGGVSVGEGLLAYRRERGLSQAAIARLIGVDPGTLSRWERNLRVPTSRYARLAGVSRPLVHPGRSRGSAAPDPACRQPLQTPSLLRILPSIPQSPAHQWIRYSPVCSPLSKGATRSSVSSAAAAWPRCSWLTTSGTAAPLH